jgi:hypothetical protein
VTAWEPKLTDRLLKKAFATDEYASFENRAPYLMNFSSFRHDYNFFNSYYNSICLKTLSVKVPNSKYLYSRFFLNTLYNKATLSNILR